MFGNTMNSGLSLTKVLGGISKTLSIANQVIPLYREAKPMISNAKTVLSVLKDMGSKSINTNSKASEKTNFSTVEEKKDTNVREFSGNNPVFFL